jgi:hypothetical protein
MQSTIAESGLGEFGSRGISNIVAQRRERIVHGHPRRPVVAIVSGASTRGSHITHPEQIGFFARAKTSLLYAEPGFEYWVVFAVDDDDFYYGRIRNQDAVADYFKTHVAKPLWENIGVRAHISLVPFSNSARKPGPAFNVAAASAYADGADFIFRINDDTILTSKWTKRLVAAIEEMDPPLVGTAGPLCVGNRANTDIMTHDFVHRSHLDIFDTYYPVVLADWWMDEWMTNVYGNARTCILPDVRVGHTTGASRYKVQSEHACFLEPLILEGRERVQRYIELLSRRTVTD